MSFKPPKEGETWVPSSKLDFDDYLEWLKQQKCKYCGKAYSGGGNLVRDRDERTMTWRTEWDCGCRPTQNVWAREVYGYNAIRPQLYATSASVELVMTTAAVGFEMTASATIESPLRRTRNGAYVTKKPKEEFDWDKVDLTPKARKLDLD